METSRKRLHSSSYEFLGGGLQPQQKPLESAAVESIMNNIYVNLNFFETQQRVKILDDLIMRIVSVKKQVLQADAVGLSTSSTNAPPPPQPPPPKLIAKSPPRLPPTTTTTTASSLTEQQFSEFQQNLLRQQLYSNVQYLPQYSQYQRVIPDPKMDPLVKFHQLLEESSIRAKAGSGNGSSSSGESGVYQPRMMAPPRIAPTPTPAPPILTPQVTKPEVKKPFIHPKVRSCNQWSVVSLALPLTS